MNVKELKPTLNVGGTIYTPIEMSEVKAMIHSAVKEAVQTTTAPKTEKKFIKGIHQLAKFLNVSPSKAQDLKNSGKIPFSQNGRLILFDPEKVMEALSKK